MNACPIPSGQRTTIAMVVIVVAALLLPVSGHSEPPARLYHRFQTGAIGQWAAFTVPMRPGEWRVGAEDGPVASAEQWQAVFAAARGLAIGAHCRGSNLGNTHYPCEVELARPAWLPARNNAKAADIAGWQANSGGTLVNFGNGSVAAASSGTAVAGPSVPAAGSSHDLVSLLAPAEFVARPAARDATGLQFRLRLSYSPLAKLPGGANRAEGWVILSTEPHKVIAPPALPMSDRRQPAPGQPI